MLLRLGFDSRCALTSPPVDPVGQLVPLPTGGPTMRATEWAVNRPPQPVVGRRSSPLPSLGPCWRGGRVRFGERQVFFEQDLGASGIEIPDLELPAPRRDQQVSFSIPVRPLEVIQQLDLSIHFQPVADTQPVYRLIDAEFASSPSEAFHTQ